VPLQYRDVTLLAILQKFRYYWWVLAGSIAVCMIAALFFLAQAEPRFSVTMKLAVSEDDTSRASLAQQGLLSLAMLAGGGMQNQDLSRYLERLSSPPVAEYLQEQHQVLQQIFPHQWDAASQQWKKPMMEGFSVTRGLKRLAGLPLWTPPSLYTLGRYIATSVRTTYDTKSNMLQLSLYNKDPVFAMAFLTHLHEAVVFVTRQQSLERIEQRAMYLRERVKSETLQEYRLALFTLLANEEKKKLLMAHEVPFYIEVFAPPTASSEPVSPRPKLLMAIALLAGITLGVVLLLLLDALRAAAQAEADALSAATPEPPVIG
jgi:uncharacterized protein involved in exopolysaccharide biosynthesis